jgi:rubrerythrin
MATSDPPPIGLDHPTANPHAATVPADRGQSDTCVCRDCGYTVEIDAEVPPTCPQCDGALTRSTAADS